MAAHRGVPLSHVADRAGLARSYFWLLLEARSSATLSVLQRLADVLEVEPTALLVDGGSEEARDVEPPRVARRNEEGASRRRSPARRRRPREAKA
jgi:transcriptional regulator with XRE-family HTH domain